MKDLFVEYISLSKNDFSKLWNDCIFVFDANVLLNFYRYSSSTCDELFDALEHYSDRIWLPYQAAHEFFVSRLSVINEQSKNYGDFKRELSKFRELLVNKKGHPFLSQNSQEVFEQTYQLLNEEFSEQEKYLFDLVSDDTLVDKISVLFNDKIGAKYSDSELLSIYKEGQQRFNNLIPPGYKDASKPEPGRYGDLIIWKQLIDKAIKDKKNILLVSDDEKEDWLLRTSGKTVGPRVELIREFINATGQKFHINSAFKFLQNSYEFRNKIISQPTLDEVKSVSKERRQLSENENRAYQIKCVIRSDSGGIGSINNALDILSAQGYSFKSDIIDDASFRIQVNVPYEDLVRRFNNKILELSKSYDFLVDSFEASVFNNQ